MLTLLSSAAASIATAGEASATTTTPPLPWRITYQALVLAGHPTDTNWLEVPPTARARRHQEPPHEWKDLN